MHANVPQSKRLKSSTSTNLIAFNQYYSFSFLTFTFLQFKQTNTQVTPFPVSDEFICYMQLLSYPFRPKWWTKPHSQITIYFINKDSNKTLKQLTFLSMLNILNISVSLVHLYMRWGPYEDVPLFLELK